MTARTSYPWSDDCLTPKICDKNLLNKPLLCRPCKQGWSQFSEKRDRAEAEEHQAATSKCIQPFDAPETTFSIDDDLDEQKEPHDSAKCTNCGDKTYFRPGSNIDRVVRGYCAACWRSLNDRQ